MVHTLCLFNSLGRELHALVAITCILPPLLLLVLYFHLLSYIRLEDLPSRNHLFLCVCTVACTTVLQSTPLRILAQCR